MAVPQGPPACPKNGVTGGGPPDKAVGGCGDPGQGPESGAAQVDVTCDPPDWSYSYSIWIFLKASHHSHSTVGGGHTGLYDKQGQGRKKIKHGQEVFGRVQTYGV